MAKIKQMNFHQDGCPEGKATITRNPDLIEVFGIKPCIVRFLWPILIYKSSDPSFYHQINKIQYFINEAQGIKTIYKLI